MPITEAQRTEITKITVAMFGAAPGAYLGELETLYQAVGNNATAFANALASSDLFTSANYFPSSLSNQEKATKMAANFGLTDITAGAGKTAYDYFLTEINKGTPLGTLFVVATDYLSQPNLPAEFQPVAQALENKTIVAKYYSDNEGASVSDVGALGGLLANVDDQTDVSTPEAIQSVVGSVAYEAAAAEYMAAKTAYEAAQAAANDAQAAAEDAVANVTDLDSANAALGLAQTAQTAATEAQQAAQTMQEKAQATVDAAAATTPTDDDAQAATYLDEANNAIAAATATLTAAEATQATAQTVIDNATPQTFTVDAAASTVVEGNAIDFTVTADHPRDIDVTVNYQIEGVLAAGGTADPLTDLGILNGSVTILAGETTATITLTPADDANTEGFEGFKVNLLDDNFAPTTSSGTVVIQDAPNAGQTFTLTTGVDSQTDFTGGIGNDIFNGVIDPSTPANSTFTVLDYLDGGDGTDTFNLNALSAVTALPNATVTNIETMNIAAADAFTADVSGYTGLTTANVTQTGGALDLTAASTTDMNVSGATDTITLNGGKNITVNDATADKNIAIGATTVNNGTITVTDTKLGTGAISIEGGTDVTVTAIDDVTSSGISIGDTTTYAAAKAPTGDVVVNAEFTAKAATDDAAGVIAVDGGAAVTVNQTVTSSATVLANTTGQTITQGGVTITGQDATTTVTVNQTISTAETPAVTGVTGVAETNTVTFIDMLANETVTIDGLTFTATRDLTAAEVASAFSKCVF